MKSLAIAVVLASSPVFADPPGLTEPVPSAPEVGSYRLEVAAIDASVVGALALGHNNNAVIGLAITTYVIGAPILHAVHGRPGEAVGSLTMRVGLPLLGIALGWAVTANSDNHASDVPPGFAGAVVGLLVGTIAASAIDIGVLAKGDEAPRLAPAVTPTPHGGMTFGLTGSF